jgi:methylmalonyl-CoA/ethylmalonyl-CoA epimerase
MFIDDKKIGTIPDNRILLREIVHVCVVVRNVEATAKKLVEKYGIGPFEVRKKTYPESHATIHGEPVSYTLKFGYCKVGSIVLELVETIKGKTIYNEFLEEHGEGIHHIGFPTPLPFEKELKKWEKQGINALQISKLDDPEEGWAYMDTQNDVGFIMEILSFKKYQ